MGAGKYIIICPNFRQILIQTSGVQNNWDQNKGIQVKVVLKAEFQHNTITRKILQFR
jgi:hypothetical protein